MSNTPTKTCCRTLFGNYQSYACNRPAKFEVDGKHYCGIHNPNKAKTKAQIASEARYEEEKKRWRLERAAPELLEALNTLVQYVVDGAKGDHMEGAVRTAERAIYKATGEQA